MGGNDNSNGRKKGFAGLSSMVSDVDTVIAETSKPPPRSASPSAGSASAPPPRAEPKPAPREPIYSPPEAKGISYGTKVLISFGAMVAVLLAGFAAMDDTKSTSSSQTPNFTYTPSTTPAAPAPLPAPKPAAPSRPTEDRPPTGRNNVLAGAQLRYCVAEQIRVDAAEKVVNNYIEAHVDRFNAMVGDYNSRCGEFRYRQGSLQSAERAMEPYRSQLEQEGRGRIVRIGTTGSTRPSGTGQFVPDVQPQKPPPDPTVLAIQRRLNQLGYNAGTADGYSGQRTVAAIRHFQNVRGLTPDGRPTELLLIQLNTPAPEQAVQRDSRPASALTTTNTVVNTPRPSSRDMENLRICLSGQYPDLCKRSLLTPDEVAQADAAERRANFTTCISGPYPALCKRGLLTSDEASQVQAAERRANFNTCISGQYPALCKHALLTTEEARQVDAAERRANYQTCSTGQYPALCKHNLLTPDQAVLVASAERAVNLKTCLSGMYPSLCKHSLLSAAEREQVANAERLAVSR